MTRRLRLLPFAALLAALLSPLLLARAMPAQGGRPARPDKPAAAPDGAKKPVVKVPAAEPPKDDAITAKDPVVIAIDKFRKAKVNAKRADWKSTLPAPPEQTFANDRDWFWHVETSKGTLQIRLLPEAAPKHVTSTIYLSRCGFYDGLSFPRILKGFMAQAGSPFDTQAGNAGYTLDGEFLGDQKHDRPGVLSAANSGQPNTDGSQFFLTFVPTPHLDGKHTVYGITVEGVDVLQAIEACGVDKDGEALRERVTIVRTWIRVAERKPAPGSAPAEPKK